MVVVCVVVRGCGLDGFRRDGVGRRWMEEEEEPHGETTKASHVDSIIERRTIPTAIMVANSLLVGVDVMVRCLWYALINNGNYPGTNL